jgi:cyclic lactone autoinducer peptide
MVRILNYCGLEITVMFEVCSTFIVSFVSYTRTLLWYYQPKIEDSRDQLAERKARLK